MSKNLDFTRNSKELRDTMKWNKVVYTREQLKTAKGTIGDIIFQKDIDLKYEWVEPQLTDNGGTIINTNGDTIGSWKAIFSGNVNPIWFGVKSGESAYSTANSIAFDKVRTYCKNNSLKAVLPDGNYYISETLVLDYDFSGTSRKNTVIIQNFPNLKYGDGEMYATYDDMISSELETRLYYHYSDTTKNIFEYVFPKTAVVQLISHEYLEVSNFSVKGGNDAIYNDDTLTRVIPVTCVSTFNFNLDNKEMIHHFNRSKLSNIRAYNGYVLYALTGWISIFDSLFGTGGYIGAYMYEFNNNSIDIKMENVKLPLDIHEADVLFFNTVSAEGYISMLPSQMSRCKNIEINGIYVESNGTNNPLFEIGVREAVNPPWNDYNKCFNINILNCLPGTVTGDTLAPVLKIDSANGITLTGLQIQLDRPNVSTTNLSMNVNHNGFVTTSNNIIKTIDNNIKPLNLSPNPVFKYNLSGYYFADRDSTHTIIESGVEITSPRCGKVIKVVADGNGLSGISLYLKYLDFPKYLKAGDQVSIGVWVYVPYTNDTKDYTPFLSSRIQDLDSNGSDGVGKSIVGKPVYITSTHIVPENLSHVIATLYMNTSGTMPAGTVMYLMSFDVFCGSNVIAAGNNNFNPDFSPIATDTGSYLKYKTTGVYYNNIEAGARIDNPDYGSVDGASPELVCNNFGDSFNYFIPIGIPPVLPTINQGAGTWWLNNGVLTQGSD